MNVCFIHPDIQMYRDILWPSKNQNVKKIYLELIELIEISTSNWSLPTKFIRANLVGNDFLSFKVHNFSVLEKKVFDEFLPNMGMMAVLVNRLEPCGHVFIPSTQGGSIWNRVIIFLVISSEKSNENVDSFYMILYM